MLGIPMTASEIAEIHQRTTIGDALGGVDQLVQGLLPGTTFAGTWQDFADNGAAVFASTIATPQTVRTLIATSLPSGTPVKFPIVAVASQRLNDLDQAILADQDYWHSRGISMDGWGIYPMDNRVVVDLPEGTPESAGQEILARYGGSGLGVDLHDVGVLTAGRQDTTGPLYGGHRVRTGTGTDDYCTAALTGKNTAGTTSYGISAGHCERGGPWRQGTSSGTNLGSGLNNGFFGPAAGSTIDCDCTAFGPISSSKVTPKVIVNGPDPYTYGNYASKDSNYVVGTMACISGSVTNEVLCSKIQSKTATVGGERVTIRNMIEVWCGVKDGDSGAPVGLGRHVVGHQQLRR